MTTLKRTGFTPVLLAAFALSFGATAHASIQRLDLPSMVELADDAIDGTIVRRRVIRIDHPKDGEQLYFTIVSIEGRSLASGAPLAVDVAYAGGFVDAQHGVWNSEAPAADDVRIGNRVVAFFKHTPNMGGDFAANAICAAHGGIYRAFESRRGTIVQGRGAGYAIAGNVELEGLRANVAALALEKAQRERANARGVGPQPGTQRSDAKKEPR